MLTVVLWTSLLGDSPIGDHKPNRVINRFVNRLEHDFFGIVADYSDLCHRLVTSMRRDAEGVMIGTYLKQFNDTPIAREYHRFMRTGDPQLFRFILSFLSFGKKTYYKSSDLDTAALRGWLEVEDHLGTIVLPPYISNLRCIMQWIFSEWSDGCFLPRHGNGAVAERGIRGIAAKNDSFALDPKIAYLYMHNCVDDVVCAQERRPKLGVDQRPELRGFVPDVSPTPSPPAKLPQTRLASRLKFVPKDWRKTRSICMEPVVFQWAQQGVRLWYEENLERGVLKNHVFLKNQKMNQEGARYGSKTNRLDTLDLSSASDSVSWDLVKQIFPAKVLKHLMGTRTSVVELPDKTERKVKKYAPMGSALCFPVQSTIYSAIALMVGIAEYWGRDWRQAGCFDGVDLDKAYRCFERRHFAETKRLQPFLTYGDDIVCDKRMTSSIVEALTDLGFKVNKEKSFTGQQLYRESCGIHCLDGDDVSPYTLTLKKVSLRMSIDTLAGLIDHANRALEFGYLALRRHLIQIALYYPIQGVRAERREARNPILFSQDVDESFAILCDNPRNTHLRTREYDPGYDLSEPTQPLKKGRRPKKVVRSSRLPTHIRYQRDEVRSITLGPSRKRELLEKHDRYRYTVWWRSKYSNGESGDFSTGIATADTLRTGVRWRWTAIGA